MERVSLFTESTPKRYKLFSEVEENAAPEVIAPRIVRCIDCGYEMETAEESEVLYCPNCGGTRFETIDADHEKVFSNNQSDRVKLFCTEEELEAEFQKVFSET